MKFTPPLVCIFLLICAVASEDLMCYSCFYYTGHNSSDSSCLSQPDPSTLKNCSAPVIHGLLYGVEFGMDTNTSIINYGGVNIGRAMQVNRLRCANYTGKLNNKDFMIRSCSLVDDTFKDNCEYSAYVSLDGVNANSTKVCMCSSDKCNSDNNKKSHNGATGTLSTSYLLLAVTTIYFMYKCIS